MAEKSYREQLNDKLVAARKRVAQGRQMKALKYGAPALLEIIDGEVSLLLNKAFDSKPLPYEEYLSAHGEMRGMKRIRDLMNAKEVEEVSAAQEATAIRENLEKIDEQKQ